MAIGEGDLQVCSAPYAAPLHPGAVDIESRRGSDRLLACGVDDTCREACSALPHRRFHCSDSSSSLPRRRRAARAQAVWAEMCGPTNAGMVCAHSGTTGGRKVSMQDLTPVFHRGQSGSPAFMIRSGCCVQHVVTKRLWVRIA